MTTLALKVTPNADGFGAEIRSVDLSRPLPPGVLHDVKAAFAAHGVVWFPDQPLTHDQLEAFTLQLGAFGWDPYVKPMEDRPHILEVRRDADETASVFGGTWHSDWSFQETPPAITILHAKIVPPVGGDTLYADGVRAWEALSPTFQAMIAPLRSVHSAAGPYGSKGFYAQEKGRTGMTILPSVEAEKAYTHPLVRTHPVTGKKALYVNRRFTTRINGLPKDESDALLAYLFQHLENPLFQCRFAWQEGSIAFWDNRCTQHRAMWDYWPHQRYANRVTVLGEAPV